MLHTVTISCALTNPEEIRRLMLAFGFRKSDIKRVLDLNNSARMMLWDRCPGISYVKVSRITPNDYFWMPTYFVTIKLNPQALLEGRHTVHLYTPSETENRRLTEAFCSSMAEILHGSYPALHNLASWNCSRIDYSINLQFPSEADADIFKRLADRTSRHVRRQQKKLPKDRLTTGVKDTLVSTAEGNKSSKVITYKKAKEIIESWKDISPGEKDCLLNEAENIIRFEIQCGASKVKTMKKTYCFPDRSVMNYLNVDVASSLLLKTYLQTVGEGDFFSFYEASKNINASSYTKKMKAKLIKIIRLIAQSRGVAKGKRDFIEGKQLKYSAEVLKGSGRTFDEYLKRLRAIGLHPYLIPKDWPGQYLKNPIWQIQNMRDKPGGQEEKAANHQNEETVNISLHEHLNTDHVTCDEVSGSKACD